MTFSAILRIYLPETERGGEYSFSFSLGGSPIALIGYYLSSPVNILLIFFKKSQIQLFVYISTMIKLGLCGLFSYIFFSHRFKIQKAVSLGCSLAYAFMLYTVSQMSNIMWLDGVYLLPLIMLGVYRYVTEEKRLLFYVSTACSIIFCWYTGYMNCLFAVIYYIFETALRTDRFHLKEKLKKDGGFLLTEFLSVLLSCVVFIPVLIGQSSGRIFDKNIFGFKMNGKLVDVFQGLLIGVRYSYQPPVYHFSFFITIVGLLFFFSFWFSRKIHKKEKLITGCLAAFMLFSMLFSPLEHIWCGFKYTGSYCFRFGYIVFMTVIFIAAMYAERMTCGGRLKITDRSMLHGAGAFIASLFIAEWVSNVEQKKLYFEIVFIILYTLIFYFLNSTATVRIKLKRASVMCLAVMFFAEVIINAKMAAVRSYSIEAEHNTVYTEEQQDLADRIRPSDTEFYRIEQMLNRGGGNKFYANESLAYNWAGIQSYTSCYDSSVSDIITAAGYCTSSFPSFYINPILPADSLLGIRYLMSDRDYAGYYKTDIPGANGKVVYENPYVLPLGFRAADTVLEELEYSDAFEYSNAVYSAVLGEPVEVFHRIYPSSADTDAHSAVFRFDGNDDGILYFLINEKVKCGSVRINDKDISSYDNISWGSWDSVRYLGTLNSVRNVTFSECSISPDKLNPLFYIVDIQVLAAAAERLQNDSMRITAKRDGFLSGEYISKRDGYIMLTVPYNDNWSILLNSREIEPLHGAGGFIAIPVTEGKNSIVLQYSAPGKYIGACLSILSVIMYTAFYYLPRRKRNKNRLNQLNQLNQA